MKLASLKHGRDGKLVIVSKDLTKATDATSIASTLQAALDNWATVKPKLEQLSKDLESGKAPSFTFDTKVCASPLPRAYQWADGSAYVNHVELVRKARGVEMPATFWTDPLMYQGGSDSFLGPHEDIAMETEEWGIDFEAEVAVITDDVPMGVTAEDAAQHIQLLMLVNDVSLRYIAQPELTKGFGFFQSKPSTAFSPVALTPDELGGSWKDGKVHLPITSFINGTKYGSPHAGVDMVFNFPQLIAHAAKTRPLCAGTIIGSGTVSNKGAKDGYACLVEKRMVEKIEKGESTTPFLKFGDSVRIEMNSADGKNLFGAIEQTVRPYKYQPLSQQRKTA